MSWLNLNESLNSIKGQISSFASGVLADGIVNDADPFTELSVAQQKIQELQNLCASQDVEIASLRRQNAEFCEKISFASKTNNEHQETSSGGNGENWFWDPPTSDSNSAQRKNSTNSAISDLNKRILNLEVEKKELIQNMEQLDLECQRNTEKLVAMKNNLQAEYNNLRASYDLLKSENSNLTKEILKCKSDLAEIHQRKSVSSSSHLENSAAEIQQIKEIHQRKSVSSTNLENSTDDFKKLYEELKIKFDKLVEEKGTLEDNYESSQSLLKKLQVDFDKLSGDFERLRVETVSAEKHKQTLNDYENLQNLYGDLDGKYKTAQEKVLKLKTELEEVKENQSSKLQSNLSDDHKKLQDMYDELKILHENLGKDKKELHIKYLSILTDAVKKYADCQIPEEFAQKSNDFVQKNESGELSEFNSKVEAVIKVLRDFKWKSENLERKLQEISHENPDEEKHSLHKKYLSILTEAVKKYDCQIPEECLQKSNGSGELSEFCSKVEAVIKVLRDFKWKSETLERKLQEISGESPENEKHSQHKKYVSILTETVKKYVDYQIPEEFVQKPNESSEISEFNSKVEAVLKLLLDFKWKTETLERKLCEISHEKTIAIAEKNHEIEKLLHNSEILSQEVITKTQTIKHYENECAELIKNNDLLIAELQTYKKNNGLQTISESNEDNLLLLETQLENSNKRIRELELIINDMENAKQDIAVETQSELDLLKRELNSTGKELSQSKKEYQELLKAQKVLEEENGHLNSDLENLKLSLDIYHGEKLDLESLLEKMKSELENSDYKFTEANVNLETVREELQDFQKKFSTLSSTNFQIQEQNKNLDHKSNLLQNEILALKSQLDSLISIREQLELQVRSLTEKLQSSKMSETGLKLQNDTIKKEVEMMSELHSNLEQKVQKYEQEFFQINKVLQQIKLGASWAGTEVSWKGESLTVVQQLEGVKRHILGLEKNSEILAVFQSKLEKLQNENLELLSLKETLKKEVEEGQKINKSLEEESLGNLTLLQSEIKKLQTQNLELLSLTETLERKMEKGQEIIKSFEEKNTHRKLEEGQKVLKSLEQKNLELEAEIKKIQQEKLEIQTQNLELLSLKETLERKLDELHKIINSLQEKNPEKKLEEGQEVLKSFQEKNLQLEAELKKIWQEKLELQTQNLELLSFQETSEKKMEERREVLESLEEKNSEMYEELKRITQENLKLQSALGQEENLKQKVENSSEQISQLELLNQENCAKILQLQSGINSLNSSKAELVNLVTTKHQENIQYHSEIQRLNQALSSESERCKNLEAQISSLNSTLNSPKSELENTLTLAQKTAELEKLSDQNAFLKEKCEKLAQNLLEEQSNSQKILTERHLISEKEQSLTKELERLRMHLVEIEDSYTRELLQAEQKNQEMLAKVNEIEQRERDSSTIYTSVSIRANQQVETLQNQLQLVTAQRDELQKKVSEAEDKNNKQLAALTNLQCVLEQFQRDREKDIMSETERIRRQINTEKQKQNELQEEIATLKSQLDKSKQGLKAAARLTEQIEKSKLQVVTMKDEVTKLQDQLSKTEEKHRALQNQTDAKVDKTLIKNLIVGFISCNTSLNKDQAQILKIISTVLDFTQQDNDKLTLNRTSGSWLTAILHPQTVATSGSSLSQQSLSEAFVRFLESESQPKPAPPPLINVRKMSTESNASNCSSSRQTPLLLNEVVLPTFADFAQNRNSSSILKDVLKEN